MVYVGQAIKDIIKTLDCLKKSLDNESANNIDNTVDYTKKWLRDKEKDRFVKFWDKVEPTAGSKFQAEKSKVSNQIRVTKRLEGYPGCGERKGLLHSKLWTT